MLQALSPLDGRYANKMTELQPICSEFGLVKYRTIVEIEWLIAMCENDAFPELKKLSPAQVDYLRQISTNFSEADAQAVKDIESTTNHDVKAVEYFLRTKLDQGPDLADLKPFIHFACTSEDINNTAYGLMMKNAIEQAVLPTQSDVITKLTALAKQYRDIPMMARTHGQPASPTTLGKEIYNVVARLQRQHQQLQQQIILGKFNGAVGNFNAHVSAYPDADWPSISQTFVESLGLSYNPMTTQIEPHDYIAEAFDCTARFNTILIDLDRDIWSYISLGYFKQRVVEGEVGSSTMPHKVNPIDFENSEGNLGLANAIAQHLASKLPVSRWQRDLTDSTVLRNIGLVFGYSLLAYKATLKGLNKLEANEALIRNDLDQHWELLAEPIQTVMRRYGITDAYEQLKAFSRGKILDQAMVQELIAQLEIPSEAKERLLKLTPSTYIGIADKLC